MEQKFEGTPRAEIRADGKRVLRTAVTNDWGLRLQWVVTRDGKVVATPNARPDDFLDLAAFGPGTYEVVLQLWKYVNYAKTPAGEFTASKYIDISNKVTLTV
jgi:hypothetical protein